MISVEVKGMDKAIADLRGYSKEVSRKVTQAINDTTEDVRGDAIRLAPVNKQPGAIGGQLRRLIVSEPAINFEATVESRAKYSAFVEFGTGRRGSESGIASPPRPMDYSYGSVAGMRAQPFLNPAAEMNRRKHSERMIKALKG